MNTALKFVTPGHPTEIHVPFTEGCLYFRRRPSLLNFPREIRDLIYHFTLVEPPRWTKHHNALCRYAVVDTATNVFHFWTGFEFLRDVRENLRDEYKALIQHVVIMHHTMHDFPDPGPFDNVDQCAVWELVLTCSGLRSLEVPDDMCNAASDYPEYAAKLAVHLPHLERFAINILMLRTYDPATCPVAGNLPRTCTS
ncbi:unnamed protein product [Parascedosporium putredinis]|uniref:Uncharacterized protein n=1 Tax=Parascedosporium putredinis TaxID=1442378 RepID=A0A9P1M7Y1_9PEZI|nr:unnamed protein product [Parascedosporium putredinis]CAI7989080.1 unnamed protein product [Parascedosporium putredinis]